MYEISISEEYNRFEDALKSYESNAEKTINEVLHGEGAELLQTKITRLMPVSGKNWRGKKAPAKTSKSLRSTPDNLAVTIRSAKAYQYLYFPDDGTNTRRHIGNQQFFARGGENAKGDIIDRCVSKLTNIIE